MDDIVERLRKGDPCGNCKRDDCRCVIMEDAADDIERLRKESRLYWDAFQKAANEIEKLQKDILAYWNETELMRSDLKIYSEKIERFREALESFSCECETEDDCCAVVGSFCGWEARAALKEGK